MSASHGGRRTRSPAALSVAVLALLVLAPPSEVRAGDTSDTAVVVELSPAADSTAVMRRAGVSLERRLPSPRTFRVRASTPAASEEAMVALRGQPGVISAELDRKVQLAAAPRELGKRLWGLDRVRVEGAWGHGYGNPSTVVAVVDTGVDFTHKDLAAGQWTNPGETGNGREANGLDDDGNGFVDDWRGWDFQAGDADPGDFGSHGTHVAGTIGARANGTGVVGVAPNSRVMSLKACDETGCWESDVAAALRYASAMGAQVVNVSIISPLRDLPTLQAIHDAPQTLFVAAAGNRGLDLDLPDNHAFPCEHALETANVLCVGASNDGDHLASFSNHGAGVQITAPGTGILSTTPRNRYTESSGTSMAAPHVAGGAALLLAQRPGATPSELRRRLIDGDALSGFGVPRLNLERAMTSGD